MSPFVDLVSQFLPSDSDPYLRLAALAAFYILVFAFTAYRLLRSAPPPPAATNPVPAAPSTMSNPTHKPAPRSIQKTTTRGECKEEDTYKNFEYMFAGSAPHKKRWVHPPAASKPKQQGPPEYRAPIDPALESQLSKVFSGWNPSA